MTRRWGQRVWEGFGGGGGGEETSVIGQRLQGKGKGGWVRNNMKERGWRKGGGGG